MKSLCFQGKAKKTRKFAAVKRLLHPKDIRLFALHTLLPVNGLMSTPQEGESIETEEEG
jgi:hypothetical protein